MLIPYIRSSLISGWDWCHFKTFLTSNLGLEDPSGESALKGCALHKALEMLANKKLAIQKGEGEIKDPETGTRLSLLEATPNTCLTIAFEHYSQENVRAGRRPWTTAVKRTIGEWLYRVLDNPTLSPLDREVIMPELYFELPMEFDWAEYNYDLGDGRVLSGKLHLRGTMDLITRVCPGIIEATDWKSGKLTDWSRPGHEKDYEYFRKDPQLLLYHYALTRLFPDENVILMTIYYVAEGRSFTLHFDADDNARTELFLREFFEEVNRVVTPGRIINDPRNNWKCQRMCSFFKNKMPDGRSRCDYYWGELQQLGLKETLKKHANLDKAMSYNGGGRTAEENARETGGE